MMNMHSTMVNFLFFNREEGKGVKKRSHHKLFLFSSHSESFLAFGVKYSIDIEVKMEHKDRRKLT